MDEVREKFFLKIVKKLESLENRLKGVERNLVKNKAKVLKYLKDQKWTQADMNSQWFTDQGDFHYYGK